jgi:1,4-alpha-glucan branching enzyme
MIHTNYTGKISIAEDVYNSFGFNSAWDTDYPYTLTPQLADTVDSERSMTTIANAIRYNVRYGGTAGSGRVVFLESHDVVGDLNSGKRLVTSIDSTAPASYRARKLSTLGSAVTFTAPGIPMIFQGQEMLENQAFDSGLDVDWTKTNTYSYIVQFYHDIIAARRNLNGYTPGLEGDQCQVLQEGSANQTLVYDRWNSADTNENAVIFANFADESLTNYAVTFPSDGTWYVHLNSDSTNYGPDYSNVGSTVVTATGSPATANVTIGPYSALIFSQAPNTPPQLTIAPAGGAVTVSWPFGYAGWVLEESASIGNSSWTEVPVSQYQTNATTVSVTVTPSSGNTFYQLQSP